MVYWIETRRTLQIKPQFKFHHTIWAIQHSDWLPNYGIFTLYHGRIELSKNSRKKSRHFVLNDLFSHLSYSLVEQLPYGIMTSQYVYIVIDAQKDSKFGPINILSESRTLVYRVLMHIIY